MADCIINGINMHYEIMGKGNPLVLIHEFAGRGCQWWQWGVVKPLSCHYRVITYDCRGHGQTDSPLAAAEYTIEALVKDLAQLLKHLGVEKVYLCGHSMGGRIALFFALHHPALLKALIISAMGPGSLNEDQRSIGIRKRDAMAQILESRGFDNYWDQCGSFHLPDETGIRAEQIRGEVTSQSPIGIAHMHRLVGALPVIVEKLGEITAPTLILVGEQDQTALLATEVLHQSIRQSIRMVFPNTGHRVPMQAPEQFNSAVLSFLGRLKK